MKRNKIVALLLIAALIGIKISADWSRWKQIPDLSGFTPTQSIVKRQIRAATLKAYLHPSHKRIGVLGMSYHANAYYDEASACYELASRMDNADWIWNYYLGYLKNELGESNEALDNFLRVVEKSPENELAWLYAAYASQNIGLSEKAEELFRMVINKRGDKNQEERIEGFVDFPVHTYAEFGLARIFLNTDRIDSAGITLKRLIQNQPWFGPAYRSLANVFYIKGSPDLGNRYTLLANDLDEYAPPSDTLANRISLMSRTEATLLKEVDDALNRKNQKLALQLCDQAMKYLPDSKELLSKAVFGYYALGFDEKAKLYLNRHFQYFISDFDELMEMAGVLDYEGYTEEATKYFEQAKKLQPDNSRLALWLFDIGRQTDAIILLDAQLSGSPDNPEMITDAIKLTLRMNNVEMAKTYLTRLKRVAPESKSTFKLAGVISEQEGDLPSALGLYEESYRRDSSDFEMIRYLAEVYIRESIWSKAIDHFRNSLVTYPNDPVLLQGLGNILLTCPVTEYISAEEGIDYATRAFMNYRSNLPLRISAGRDLARGYAMTGDAAKSLYYMERTTKMAKDSYLLQEISLLFATLKKQYNIH
jgi:tetratricopeptide (TPR) repeat protein